MKRFSQWTEWAKGQIHKTMKQKKKNKKQLSKPDTPETSLYKYGQLHFDRSTRAIPQRKNNLFYQMVLE